MSRIAWAAVALAAGLALCGGGGSAQHAHDHGGQDGHGARLAAPASGTVLYVAEDLHFLQHMIVHHQQALDLAALVPARTDRAELARFAGYVADAQRAEMRLMQGMLDMAAARGLSLTAHTPHGDPPMAGMLSRAEMAALEAAGGAGFERLWLEFMIFHHEGGLAMARAQELQQALHRRQPYGIAVLLDEILVVQRAEIHQMRGWLEEWDLAVDGDRRAPAVDVISPVQDAIISTGRPVVLFGAAADDAGIAAVYVAVGNLDTGQWLRADGTWGAWESLPAALVGSGPAGAAWRFDVTPPAPGRYAVEVEVEDTAGKRAAAVHGRAFTAAS